MSDQALQNWVSTVSEKHGFGVPEGVEVEGGLGDDAVGLKNTPDGTVLTIKKEQDLGVLKRNFAVGPIPCYTKGTLKASIQGSLTVGSTTGGALQATCAGSLELGVGASKGGITAGPYGSVSLSAGHGTSITYSDKTGLDVQPYTFAVKGGGKVGIKVELDSGEKLDVSQECFDWELFVVNVGRYVNGDFEFIDVRAGKDMNRFLNALAQGGAKIEELVDEYAPEAVKDAAEKGAEWTAESDRAKEIADKVQEGIDAIEEETGVDVGEGIEKFVKNLVDPLGETSGEANARFAKENADFDKRLAQLKSLLKQSGLQGELRQYIQGDDIRAIWDVWQKETELVIKGKSSPESWRTMLADLVKKADEKRRQKAAWEKQRKNAEDERVQAAVAHMEGARTAALGAGNVLNNRMAKTPSAEAKSYFDQGWRPWQQAEELRNGLASTQGDEKANKASQAASLYAQAQQLYRTGLQFLP